MKKINQFIVVVCFFGVLFSCSNELDLQPLDRLTADTFYKTRRDFDGAIFASYSSIQDFWGTSTETLSERGEFWKISVAITDDIAANEATADQITRDVDALQIRAADRPFAAVYTQIYEGIYRANIVLDRLDGENELTADDKTVLAAEAKFLRAWFHFQAMKLFGTPPAALGLLMIYTPRLCQMLLETICFRPFCLILQMLKLVYQRSGTAVIQEGLLLGRLVLILER
jgi:hypothetical protein